MPNESLVLGVFGLLAVVFLMLTAPLWQGALMWFLSSFRGLWR